MLKRATNSSKPRNWSNTLRLPRSSFPARPAVEKRPDYLRQCTDELYAWQESSRPSESKTFTLHDGPPYANGSLHTGHALNKILKDIFCRFQLGQGKRVHYVPGWDCHGLPIEIKALQNAEDHRKMMPAQIRRAARALALKTVQEQKTTFKEWAVMGAWDNAYLTLSADFEIRQLRVFQHMVAKGLIYRQNKPVYWSPSSGTALAEAELEYDAAHVSLAAYVRFEIISKSTALNEVCPNNKVFLMIWTTTPWTLPANSAIAVHHDLSYCLFRIRGDDAWTVVARDLLEATLEQVNLTIADVELSAAILKGADIVGAGYTNCLQGRNAKLQAVIHADFVLASSGTGLVHVAPGHGFDDYNTCSAQNIQGIAPVDDAGRFTWAAYPDDPQALQGREVLVSGSEAILDLIRSRHSPDMVWSAHSYTHKYPIDWRTKQPVVIRSTAQWFADVGSIKDRALKAIDSVKFIPDSGKTRLASFIRTRTQWCISRQRAWGVPIPALYRLHNDGKIETVMTNESVEHIINVISQRGTDAWWTDDAFDPAWIASTLPPGSYKRGQDTMDVWFDSGTTWTQLPEAFEDQPCADVYLEGSDQHRGWFQSSLLNRIASQSTETSPSAPFRTLITHGFLLDGQGRKMSKSLGNVTSPKQIIDGSLLPPLKLKKKAQSPDGKPVFDAGGPDALRLWVASSDYTKDILLGVPVLAGVNGALQKYRITFKFLLGVLADFDVGAMQQAKQVQLELKDAVARHQLLEVQRHVHAAFCSYEPFKAVNQLNHYVMASLSAFYFETAKDPLYTGKRTERLAAQATCYEIFQSLMAMLAPITPLLVAEVLDHTSPALRQLLEQEGHHPFHRVWQPDAVVSEPSESLTTAARTASMAAVHDAVKSAQEKAREGKLMAGGLECRVVVELPPAISAEVRQFLHGAAESGELARAFVVQKVEVEDVISTETAEGMAATVSADAGGEWRAVKSFELRADGIASPHSTLARVIILRPDRGKCPRCWRYEVEEQDKHQEAVCRRCEEAVAEMGFTD